MDAGGFGKITISQFEKIFEDEETGMDWTVYVDDRWVGDVWKERKTF